MSDLKNAAAAIFKKREEILKKMGLDKGAKAPAKAANKPAVKPEVKATTDRRVETEKRVAEAKKRIADKSRAVGSPIVGKSAGKASGVVNQPKNWKK